jgi:predicted helicase
MITKALYRPFVSKFLYFSPQLNEMQNRMAEFFGSFADQKNLSLVFSDPTSQKPYMTIATDICPDMHLVGAASGSVTIARSIGSDHSSDNITDWALDQFRAYYDVGGKPKRPITKDAIFHYVYGVLHDSIYREKYALNLKREFPRIPFFADFWKWTEWGERLMALHIGYEAVEPWPLQRVDKPDEKSRKAGLAPKAMLKADKDAGNIRLDSETQLAGVPPEAWSYRLGNRSALEWILDQYKEKTPKDPTIRSA